MKSTLAIRLFSLVLLASSSARVDCQQLYWVDADFNSPRIGSVDLVGGTVATVPLVSRSLPEGLALDPVHNKIYFSELAFARANVQSVNTNLGGIGSIDSMGSAIRGIALDPVTGKIYWVSSNLSSGATILKANLDGTGKQILYAFAPAAGVNLRGIALLDSSLYWTDFSSGKIQLGSVNGSVPPTDFITGLLGPVGVAIGRDGYIYWTEANANVIKRRTLIPGTVTTLVSGLSTPQYIAVNAASGQMFWTEIGLPRIRRANVNGSSVQTLALTVTHPTGIATSTSTTAVQEEGQAPLTFALYQNFPNPFNPGTTIRYRVAGNGPGGVDANAGDTGPGTRPVKLSVFDILGREVAVLVDENIKPGEHEVRFDGSRLSTGVYFYKLHSGEFVQTRRFVLVR
jgi:hypothetical protein